MKQINVVDIEGNRVEDFDGATLKKMTDSNTKNLFDIQIRIRKRSPMEVLNSLQAEEKGIKFVLGYQDPTSEPHCVYVKELAMALGKLHFVCINSWGPVNDILLKEVEKDSNELYEVMVTYEQSTSRRRSQTSSISSFHNEPLTHHHPFRPTARESMNFDCGSNSSIWTSSFNSSFSTSPESPSWSDMGEDGMETGHETSEEVFDADEWRNLTPERGNEAVLVSDPIDCPGSLRVAHSVRILY